jgi:hypothetical protein
LKRPPIINSSILALEGPAYLPFGEAAWKAAGREHIECGWKKQHGGWPEEASNADGRRRIEGGRKKPRMQMEEGA